MKKLATYATLAALTLGLGLMGITPLNTQPALAQSGAPAMSKKVNINTASDADLLKLPGFGLRMVKEVREYRPFRNLAHFRAEMGKYLSKTQLDKLEPLIVFK